MLYRNSPNVYESVYEIQIIYSISFAPPRLCTAKISLVTIRHLACHDSSDLESDRSQTAPRTICQAQLVSIHASVPDPLTFADIRKAK